MPTQVETVEKWLEYTLDDLREQLRKQKITDTGHLLASVEGHLVGAAGGDITKLSIAYATYGMFVDMGVGRGMGKGIRKRDSDYERIRDERGRLLQHARKPRPWSSKVVGKQAMRLSIILSDYYGETTIASLSNLPAQVQIIL
jgi:hypothetical protein